MSESELQKKVDRDALIVGARKAIKRAKKKQLDEINEISRRSVKAIDRQTGKTMLVPVSDIMRNPSGFTPTPGSIADMLRSEDRRKERKIRREGNERTSRKRINRLTKGASPLTKSIIKKASEREPGGRLSRTDIKLAEQSLKNKFKIGGAMLKNPGKADLDKDGQLSSYEKKRGMAIEKAMAGKPQKALLGKLFRKKSGKATPGVMMIEGSPGGMGGLLRKLLKGKKFSKGGGKDMGSKQAMQDKLDKVNKDPVLKRLRPDRSKLLEMLDRTKPTPKPLQSRSKPRIASVQKKMMGGGLTEATNRLRAQGKMGGGMMNTMGYKKGKSVMAKGCKMGRKKPTKLY